MRHSRRVFGTMRIALTWIVMLVGCDDGVSYVPPAVNTEVEINPGEFAPVERWDWHVDDPKNTSGLERSKLRISHKGRFVDWEGVEIPIVLREKDEVLYLVGYDRETSRRANDDSPPAIRYFREAGDQLVEMSREEFPKELATQNMWLNDPKELEAVLKMDTSSVDFRHSTNAQVWRHLMTGQMSSGSVEQSLLDEFIEQYQPVKLTQIKRERSAK